MFEFSPLVLVLLDCLVSVRLTFEDDLECIPLSGKAGIGNLFDVALLFPLFSSSFINRFLNSSLVEDFVGITRLADEEFFLALFV